MGGIGKDRPLEPAPATVGVAIAIREGRDRPQATCQPLVLYFGGGQIIGMDPVIPRHAQQLVLGATEYFAEGRIHPSEVGVGARHDESIEREFEEVVGHLEFAGMPDQLRESWQKRLDQAARWVITKRLAMEKDQDGDGAAVIWQWHRQPRTQPGRCREVAADEAMVRCQRIEVDRMSRPCRQTGQADVQVESLLVHRRLELSQTRTAARHRRNKPPFAPTHEHPRLADIPARH